MTEITNVLQISPSFFIKMTMIPMISSYFLFNCRISRKLRAAYKRTARVWTNRVRAECFVVRERTNQRRLCGPDGKSGFGSCWPPGRVDLLLLPLFSATKKQSLRRRNTCSIAGISLLSPSGRKRRSSGSPSSSSSSSTVENHPE